VLGENACISGAELDHEFLFVVMGHQCDIHGYRPPFFFLYNFGLYNLGEILLAVLVI
jgi:hypothetical protein